MNVKAFPFRKLSLPLALLLNAIISTGVQGQEKTEIMVFGTVHLNQIQGFEPDMLEESMVKLKEYRPDIVGIELMPTELLNDIASRNDSTYAHVLNSFGGNRLETAGNYQKKLKLSFAEAKAKALALSKESHLNCDQLKELFELHLAAGDIVSAILQLNYLRACKEAPSIDPEIENILHHKMPSPNEVYSLIVPLALSLNHQRVAYIDNFQDEAILISRFSDFFIDYETNQDYFKGISDQPVFRTVDSLQQEGLEQRNLLPLFAYLNGNEFQTADYEAQWKIWLKSNFESKTDLSRFLLWEMRNLQIAAHIMKLAAHYPGKRILVVIGASHKYFLEKYLHQSEAITLIPFQ